MKKYINFMAGGILALAFLYTGLIVFWLVYPFQTVDIKRVELVTPKVKAGENLVTKVDFCNYTNAPRTINKQLRNSVVITLEPVRAPGGESRCGTVDIITHIPSNVMAGKYFLSVSTEIKLNPIRTDNIKWDSPTFEVVE